MPAQEIKLPTQNTTLFHIYNKGIPFEKIFIDEEDYACFCQYLEQYLSPQNDQTDTKITFNIRGKEYKGEPRQTKNYFGRVELIAYNLLPDHFHLILKELENNSVQKLMRSLGTRYAMYFNKKYNRTGPLFLGSYKSVTINNTSSTPLVHLTRYLHAHSKTHNATKYSSYPEYLGQRDSSWVSYQDNLNNDPSDHKHFVEPYKPNQEEINSFKDYMFDCAENAKPRDQTPTVPITTLATKTHKKKSNFWPILSKSTLSIGVFVMLFTLGLKNVQNNSVPNQQTIVEGPSSPTVAGIEETRETTTVEDKTELTEEIPTFKLKALENLNMREKANENSNRIGNVKKDDIFESTELTDGWYKLQLKDGTVGYIISSYVEVLQ